MTNKTSSKKYSNIIVDKGMPLKIFYLKDSKPEKQIQQDDRPTLAYLSSFIQDQKIHSQRQNQNAQKTHRKLDQSQENVFHRTSRIYNTARYHKKQHKPNNTEYVQGGQNFKHFVMQNKMIKNKTQNQRKKYSDYEDPNSLSRLLGKNWIYAQQSLSKPNVNKNSVVPQCQSIQTKQQKHSSKQKNHKLFRKQFQGFLKNKSKSEINAKKRGIQEPKMKSIVNINETEKGANYKVDPQLQQKFESYKQNPHNTQYSVRNIFEQKKANNRSQESRKHRRIVSMNASIIARLNFKQINNFTWSRIEQNKSNFTLQDFKV